jgi:serine/threonine protein kinase
LCGGLRYIFAAHSKALAQLVQYDKVELVYDKHYFADRHVLVETGAEVPFIVSKYVAAHTLGKQLLTSTLSRTQIVLGLLQVSRAMEYLHSADVIHGDVRADNILLEDSSSTSAVLIDFGIAKRLRFGDHDRTRYFGPVNIPQAVRDLLVRHADESQQLERDTLRRIFFPGLDLYFFGLLIERVTCGELFDRLRPPVPGANQG